MQSVDESGQAINAQPGYMTTMDLPKPRFKTRPQPEYLD